MHRTLPILPTGLALLAALSATGCNDARCDPHPVGEPWKPYEDLLPSDAVVCGPNRHSEAKPSDVVDDYPPTHVFVFYEERDAHVAFQSTLDHFEAAGFTIGKVSAIGEGDTALYDAEVVRDDVTIVLGVNRNDWGTQGSFDLRLPK